MRCDQRHQLGPRHHQVHLIEELALARPLRLALVTALAQAHLRHGGNVSHHARAAKVVQNFHRLSKSGGFPCLHESLRQEYFLKFVQNVTDAAANHECFSFEQNKKKKAT